MEVLWIFCLAVFGENAWCDLRDLMDEMECLVLCDMGSLVTEIVKCSETRVLLLDGNLKKYRFTEDTVAITWNHTSGFQYFP